jgi:hypothetical protein
MSMGRPLGGGIDFSVKSPTQQQNFVAPGTMSKLSPTLDPQATYGALLHNMPTAYDANFEFRARRRMIEEMLSNLRPAGAGAHLLAGTGVSF